MEHAYVKTIETIEDIKSFLPCWAEMINDAFNSVRKAIEETKTSLNKKESILQNELEQARNDLYFAQQTQKSVMNTTPINFNKTSNRFNQPVYITPDFTRIRQAEKRIEKIVKRITNFTKIRQNLSKKLDDLSFYSHSSETKIENDIAQLCKFLELSIYDLNAYKGT